MAVGGVGLVYDEQFELHAPPSSKAHQHIETPERVSVIYEALGKAKLLSRMERVAARQVTRAEALACHTAEHCDALEALAEAPPQVCGAWCGTTSANAGTAGPGGAAGSSNSTRLAGWLRTGMDMYHNEHTARTVRLAAGGVVALTARVLGGQISSGFALVRPPGHHACEDRMAGFCFLNSVAIAARYAVRQHALSRVLIVDWDVHHGDGTQAIFEDDPSVLYMSLHRFGHNFFPGTGSADQVGLHDGAGRTVNIPWRREGMGDAEYLAAFDSLLMPIARAFDPQLVLVSAGFDAASGDRVGGMALTTDAFAAMTARLKTLAGGRLVLALEGGYRPALAAKGVTACARVLLGDPSVGPAARLPPTGSSPNFEVLARSAHRVLLEVLRAQADHWPLLKGTALSHHHTLPLRLSETPSDCSEVPRLSETASESAEEESAESVHTATKTATQIRADASARKGERLSRPVEPMAQLKEEEPVPAASAPPSFLDCCRECHRWLDRCEFSVTQRKRKKAGERTCKECATITSGHASATANKQHANDGDATARMPDLGRGISTGDDLGAESMNTAARCGGMLRLECMSALVEMTELANGMSKFVFK